MKVSLSMRSQGKYDWKNQIHELEQVPRAGEYVALGPDSPWYVVQLVVHTPYRQDCQAEAYMVEVDRDQAKHQALHGKA
jgi:hypothetical protein